MSHPTLSKNFQIWCFENLLSVSDELEEELTFYSFFSPWLGLWPSVPQPMLLKNALKSIVSSAFQASTSVTQFGRFNFRQQLSNLSFQPKYEREPEKPRLLFTFSTHSGDVYTFLTGQSIFKMRITLKLEVVLTTKSAVQPCRKVKEKTRRKRT